MIYIYQIRMAPSGKAHQQIAKVKWKNPDNGKSGESTRQTMVDWIQKKNGSAYVCGGQGHMARVGVGQGRAPVHPHLRRRQLERQPTRPPRY